MNEQTVNHEAATQPIKKPFYQKWWVWVVAVAIVGLAILLFGGGSDAVQDDLLNYMNNDRTTMLTLDEEVHTLYDKATNAADDDAMYTVITEEVLPKSKELVREAERIQPTTDELKELHNLYIEAVNKQDQALLLIAAAYENQDSAVLAQANEKLDESRALIRDYASRLENLAKEHDLEIVYES